MVRSQNAGNALPADLPEQVLEALISERAQIQAAVDMGLRVSAQDVDQAEQRVAAQNGVDLDQLHQRVEQDGLSLGAYRQQLRDQLLLQRAQDEVLNQRLSITPGDVQAYVETVAERAPEQWALSQILIALPEGASALEVRAAQEQAQALRARAQAGEDFAALARQYSQGKEASAGGDLGLKARDDYPALFVQAVQGLSQGQVSDPVRSGAGVHVLKLTQRVSGQAVVLQVQTHVRHILRRVETQEQQRASVSQLRALRARILSGQSDFAQLAKDISQDGSAVAGGDLGWAAGGQFVPEFEAAMNALKPGEISPPVVSRFGVHLIQVLERRRAPMDQVAMQAWAKARIRAEKGQQILSAWAREVRAAVFVQRMDLGL
jgi:peptidyl-prolyl cis-trans isomerase SurA